MWLAMAADLVVMEVDCFVSVEVVGKGYRIKETDVTYWLHWGGILVGTGKPRPAEAAGFLSAS
jgi:hypothetical protein